MCKKLKESRTKRTPQHRDPGSKKKGLVIPSTNVVDRSYALVQTAGGEKKNKFLQITTGTHRVHINGFPNFWAIKRILERGPNIQRITMIPSFLRKLGEKHKKLCTDRGVVVCSGYHRPEVAWRENESRSVHYNAQRKFMTALEGDQKTLFDELIRFGFTSAEMAARYFCLNDEDFLTQEKVGWEFGFVACNNTAPVSSYINAVLCYLDNELETGQASKRIAGSMATRVKRLRALISQEKVLQALLEKLGIEQLPEGMPPAMLDNLEAILATEKDGRFARLKVSSPRLHKIIALRYGRTDNKWHVLQEIGTRHKVTRERIRQLEGQAFEELGIEQVH
jgi:hypothetical protein